MDKSLRDYAMRRLEKAADDLDTAQIDFDAGKYDAAVNRTYYAIFHTIRSVLALDEKEFKRHSSTIGYFQKEYLATNIVNRDYSAIIKNAFAARNAGDYDDFYETDPDVASELLEKATEFHRNIADYISMRLKESEHEIESCDDGLDVEQSGGGR